MAKMVGIDLGTTYSAVSYWDEKRKVPVIIPNLRGAYTTPSVVGLNDSGEVIVGEDAKQNFILNPDNTVWQVKRDMGRSREIRLGDKTYNPQTISAFILRYLKLCAEQHLGEPVHDAIITVPAYFQEVQKSATMDAGRVAGLNVNRLINEPTAAAVAYGVKSGLQSGEGKVYAVYDLGGGTFDVSIIDITAEDITVTGTGGDPRLGGLDMDEAMVKWTLRLIKTKHNMDLSADEAVRRRLLIEVEDVKKRLVIGETTTLSVPNLAICDGTPFHLKIPITRAQYEMLIQQLLDRSLVCLDEAVQSSAKVNNVGWNKLDGVLLVGGPTRMPVIQRMLEQRFRERFAEHGCPDRSFAIKRDLNPDEVVAMGAAIVSAGLPVIGKPPEEVRAEDVKHAEAQARETGTSAQKVEIYDVTGHSLGIALEGARFHVIIPKETLIPGGATHGPFGNVADYTTELLVEVFQGENEYVAANTRIGEVRISGLEPLPKGQQVLEIRFYLDPSGTLSTTCTDLRTKKTYEGSFTFDGITRMSKEEIEKRRRSVAEAMAYRAGPDGHQGDTPGGSVAPGPAPDIPTLPDDRVPAQFRVFWEKAKDTFPGLSGDNQVKLAKAMAGFAQAALGGDANAIEGKGYVLQDTILEVAL